MPAYVTGHTLSNKRPTGELPNKTKYFIPHGLMVLPDHNNKYSHPTRELITPSAILTGKQIKDIIYAYADEVGLHHLHLRIAGCINLTNWTSSPIVLNRVFDNDTQLLQYVYLTQEDSHHTYHFNQVTWLLAKHVDHSHLILLLHEYPTDSTERAIIKARLAGISF